MSVLYTIALYIALCCAILSTTGCTTDDALPPLGIEGYAITGGRLTHHSEPTQLKGVNALHTFGADTDELMASRGVEIVREFVGNLREQPLEGFAIQDSYGDWLHPIDALVAQHRAAGRVIMLCPFGWVDSSGQQRLLTGLHPSEQAFYPEYRERLRAMAAHFAGADDVWIEVWNEPYRWNDSNGYTHGEWYDDMHTLVGDLRAIPGFDNIIVVPGNSQGQSEAALLARGADLQAAYDGLLFDLHAYEQWLLDQSEAQVRVRMQNLRDAGLPVIFGEVGVINASGLMPVAPFLAAAQAERASVIAWLWKRDGTDQNALLDTNGNPNDASNLAWGSTYLDFLTH